MLDCLLVYTMSDYLTLDPFFFLAPFLLFSFSPTSSFPAVIITITTRGRH